MQFRDLYDKFKTRTIQFIEELLKTKNEGRFSSEISYLKTGN